MATQIGPKIGIEGEKEYKQQLQQIIQATKTLDSEMKKTTSEWNNNTSALTKNRAMAQNTQAKIELLGQKQEVLNNLLNSSVEKFGASSAAAQKYQQALNSTQASINSLNQKLSSFGNAANVSDLATKFADVGTKMQNVGQSMMAIGQRLTTSLTLPIAAAGAASMKLASDTQEAANKVDVVFGSMSEQVKEFADEALNSYGLAEGSALQMAGTFGAMATSMGLSQSQAAKMSISLTQLAADMASFYNVSTEVAQTSLQGVFTGETEALKKFGIVMTQTNLEDFAAQQGKVYSKMSEGEKVMTRYAFVMQATKDAQGDFARTSDGAANSFRVFQESLKELGSSFGESILPIITPIIQAITSLIQKFAALPSPIKNVIVVLALITAVIGPIILIIGSLISSIGALVSAIPALVAAMGAASAAMAAFSASAGPVILVIVAIVAVIGMLVGVGVLIADNWDQISDSASNMSNNIKGAFENVKSALDDFKGKVGSFISNIISAFASLPQRIAQALKNAVQAVKDEFRAMIENAKKSGADFVNGFVDGIKSKVQKIINEVKKIADTIEQYLGFSCPDKGALSKYETWMPDFMMGLAKGINQNKGIVTRAIASLSKDMALPLDANASMNMALSGANGGSVSVGGTSMNVYVDHINDLQDLIRIQNQAQQRYRMGAR